MKYITRFAPSPTGYLHIGGARTALFNYLFAKKNQGKFLLRIEDTDKKRSTKEAVDAILQGLSWLGLKNDDEVVFQSQNIERHKEIAQKLLENDQAYLCYTPAEELAQMRQAAEKQGKVFRFQSPWRDKANSQNSTVKPVVRIKSPMQGENIIEDLVQGKVTVKNEEIDDFIILRSDETPTYMLSCVVDDFDMNISHIIRGDDHLNNAFKQKIIYEAMNWQVPQFAHIPLIHGADGAKMSKRHGATSVIEYKDMGYLPVALRNYLLRLGWSHGDDEIISDENAQKWFNLENIGKSPARFDFAKLAHINKHYIKEKSADELFNLSKELFAKEPNDKEKNRILKAADFIKERSDLLTNLAQNLEVYFDDFSQELSDEEDKIILEKKSLINDLSLLLENLENYDHDSIKEAFNKFAEEKSLKMKDFGPLLRIVLTFSKSSAGGIFAIIEILGKKEVLKRIKQFC